MSVNVPSSSGLRYGESRPAGPAHTPHIRQPRFFVDAGGVLSRSIDEQLQAVRGPPAFVIRAREPALPSPDGPTGGWCAPSVADDDRRAQKRRQQQDSSLASATRLSRPGSSQVSTTSVTLRSPSRPSSAYVQHRKEELVDSMLSPVHNLIGLTDHFIQRPQFRYRPRSAASVADEVLTRPARDSAVATHARRQRANVAGNVYHHHNAGAASNQSGSTEHTARYADTNDAADSVADAGTPEIFFDSPPFAANLVSSLAVTSTAAPSSSAPQQAPPSLQRLAPTLPQPTARKATTAPRHTFDRNVTTTTPAMVTVTASDAHVPVRLRELVRLMRDDPNALTSRPSPRHESPATAAAHMRPTVTRLPTRPQSAPNSTSGTPSRPRRNLHSRPGSGGSSTSRQRRTRPTSASPEEAADLMMWLPRSFRQCEGCRTPMMPFTFYTGPQRDGTAAAGRPSSATHARRTRRGQRRRGRHAQVDGDDDGAPANDVASPGTSTPCSTNDSDAGRPYLDPLELQRLIREEVLEAFDARERVAGRNFADDILAELQRLGLSEDRILALLLAQRAEEASAETRSTDLVSGSDRGSTVTTPQGTPSKHKTSSDAATTMAVDAGAQATAPHRDRSTSTSAAFTTVADVRREGDQENTQHDTATAAKGHRREFVEVAVQTATRDSVCSTSDGSADSPPRHRYTRDTSKRGASEKRRKDKSRRKNTARGGKESAARHPHARQRDATDSDYEASTSEFSYHMSSDSRSDNDDENRARKRRSRREQRRRRANNSDSADSTSESGSDTSIDAREKSRSTNSSKHATKSHDRARRDKKRRHARSPPSSSLSSHSTDASDSGRPRRNDSRRKTTPPTAGALDDEHAAAALGRHRTAPRTSDEATRPGDETPLMLMRVSSPLLPHQLDTRPLLSPSMSISASAEKIGEEHGGACEVLCTTSSSSESFRLSERERPSYDENHEEDEEEEQEEDQEEEKEGDDAQAPVDDDDDDDHNDDEEDSGSEASESADLYMARSPPVASPQQPSAGNGPILPPPEAVLNRGSSMVTDTSSNSSPGMPLDTTATYNDHTLEAGAQRGAVAPKKPQWVIPVLISSSDDDDEGRDGHADEVASHERPASEGDTMPTASTSTHSGSDSAAAAVLAATVARAQFEAQVHSVMLLHAQLARSIVQREQMDRMDIHAAFFRCRTIVERLAELMLHENLAHRYIAEDEQEQWEDITAAAYQERATIPAPPAALTALLAEGPPSESAHEGDENEEEQEEEHEGEENEDPSARTATSSASSNAPAEMAEQREASASSTISSASHREEPVAVDTADAGVETPAAFVVDEALVARLAWELADLEKDESRARLNMYFAEGFTRPILALRIVEDEELRMREDVAFFEEMRYGFIVHEWNVTAPVSFHTPTASTQSGSSVENVVAPTDPDAADGAIPAAESVATVVKVPSDPVADPATLTAEHEGPEHVALPDAEAVSSSSSTSEREMTSEPALSVKDEASEEEAHTTPKETTLELHTEKNERGDGVESAAAATTPQEDAHATAAAPQQEEAVNTEAEPAAPVTPSSSVSSDSPVSSSLEDVEAVAASPTASAPVEAESIEVANAPQQAPPRSPSHSSSSASSAPPTPAAAALNDLAANTSHSSPSLHETPQAASQEAADEGVPKVEEVAADQEQEARSPVKPHSPIAHEQEEEDQPIDGAAESVDAALAGAPATPPATEVATTKTEDAHTADNTALSSEAAPLPTTVAATDVDKVAHVAADSGAEVCAAAPTPCQTLNAPPPPTLVNTQDSADELETPPAPSAVTREGHPDRNTTTEGDDDEASDPSHARPSPPPPPHVADTDNEAQGHDEADTNTPELSSSSASSPDTMPEDDADSSAPSSGRKRRQPPAHRKRGADFDVVETHEAGEMREDTPDILDDTPQRGSPHPSSPPQEATEALIALAKRPTPPSPHRAGGAGNDESPPPVEAVAVVLPPSDDRVGLREGMRPTWSNATGGGLKQKSASNSSSSSTHSSQQSGSDQPRLPLRYTKKRYNQIPPQSHIPTVPARLLADDDDEEAGTAQGGQRGDRDTPRELLNETDATVSDFSTSSPSRAPAIPSVSPSIVATAAANREAFVRNNKGVDEPLLRPPTPDFVHSTYRRLSEKAHADAPLHNVDAHALVMVQESEEDNTRVPTFPLPRRRLAAHQTRAPQGRPRVEEPPDVDSTEDYSSASDDDDSTNDSSGDEAPPRSRQPPPRDRDPSSEPLSPHLLLPSQKLDSETVANAAKRNFNMILSTKYVTSTQNASLCSNDLLRVPMLKMKPLSALLSDDEEEDDSTD